MKHMQLQGNGDLVLGVSVCRNHLEILAQFLGQAHMPRETRD
jgi:hypothetical protein